MACDDDYDGFVEFTLSDANAAILAALPGGVGTVTIAYYETNEDAIIEENQLPDNYTNITSPQTIYVRVENDNDCFGISSITLTVNPIPANNSITDVIGCSDTATAEFDLSGATAEALGGATGIAISYHLSLSDAETNTGAITSPYTSGPTELFVRAENTTTGCYITSMRVNLIVNPNPSITAPESIDICDDETADGFNEFDLTIRNDDITGGDPAYEVSYHLTDLDAQNDVSPLTMPYTNIANPQTVFVRVENTTTGCTSFTTLVLNVIDAPNTFTPAPLYHCDADNDGFGSFNLEDATAEITGSDPVPTVTYHETFEQARDGLSPITGAYNNIVAYEQIVFARVELPITGCFNIAELKLIVLNSPEVTEDEITYALCDYDGTADGTTTFDLTTLNASLLATVSGDPAEYTITYHLDICYWNANGFCKWYSTHLCTNRTYRWY